MKRDFFTLLELITVIAIIAIIIGMLLPALQSIKERARKIQALSQMHSIITAIRAYESLYGVLPLPDEWVDKNTTDKYDDLMALLSNVAAPQTEQPYKEGNSRRIRFLDPSVNYKNNSFLDPWGNKYLIYVDSGYSETVVVNSPSGDELLHGRVFIYSNAGQLDTIDTQKCVYSWK